MSKKIILACMCIMALSSCKKDYQKLATEFERALPDSMEVLTEQINEVDHFIYYKNKNNTELIRYDLDKESKESVSPKLDKGERIYGIFAGKENIAFLKNDNSLSSMIVFYNLKTQKFTDGQEFYSYGGDNNIAYANEADSTITGYIEDRYGGKDIFVYNFDGKLIKQETEEEPISLKYWQCVYCQTVIKSSTQPNAKETQCPKRPMVDLINFPHVWQYIGDAQ